MAETILLPAPFAAAWDWQLHAACRGLPSAQFFHPDGERGRPRARRDEQAKQICGRCLVRGPCLAHALTAQEPYGVWGGTTPEERTTLLNPAGQGAE